jgi:hypothetical protein
MKCAAIGVRMHSGWGALVAVANDGGTAEVVERRRIAVVSGGTAGSKQPYHFAKNFELLEAEKFVASCLADSTRLALAEVREVVGKLRSSQYRVVGSAVLMASGRPLPPLAQILKSHALIHAAEGEFFREAFLKACEGLRICVTGFRERHLDEFVQAAFGRGTTRMLEQVSTLGRSLGPPWTRDQKSAALAGLVVLAEKKW